MCKIVPRIKIYHISVIISLFRNKNKNPKKNKSNRNTQKITNLNEYHKIRGKHIHFEQQRESPHP